MRSIEVDMDVFSLLWSLRVAPEQSENEILKRLLLNYQMIEQNSRSLLTEKTLQEVKTSLQASGNTISPLNNDNTDRGELKMLTGKIRWVDDIHAALISLGGEAPLHQIYRSVQDRRKDAGRSVPASVEATIRRTLEDHCMESANYRGINLFKMPKGHGAGVWSLK